MMRILSAGEQAQKGLTMEAGSGHGGGGANGCFPRNQCALCGEKGHWKRSCPQNPNADLQLEEGWKPERAGKKARAAAASSSSTITTPKATATTPKAAPAPPPPLSWRDIPPAPPWRAKAEKEEPSRVGRANTEEAAEAAVVKEESTPGAAASSEQAAKVETKVEDLNLEIQCLRVFDTSSSSSTRRLALSSWLENPVIKGKGSSSSRYAGYLPQGAGIIAVMEERGEQLVCVTEKRSGVLSFPKGGLKRQETVFQGAEREWQEETGISVERLKILWGARLDEAKYGCRYLLATCAPAEAGSDDPDYDRYEWQPPNEDIHDHDPIVCASWMPVRLVFTGRTRLSEQRVAFLREAVQSLKGVDRCLGEYLSFNGELTVGTNYNWKGLLTYLYTTYNPQQLRRIDDLRNKYQDCMPTLVSNILLKYTNSCFIPADLFDSFRNIDMD